MKSLLALGLIFFAMTFCNLSERLKQAAGSATSNSNTSTAKPKTPTSSDDATAEKAEMTPAQQAIADGGKETTWDTQGISWKLPAGWNKMAVQKESINYGSPDKGFLIASVSVMPDSFPSDESLKATYESALEQLKQGKYESVRYADIDGVKGVEWTEAMPEDKDGPRRHQWIAFRHYLGQNQQLNVMVSTKGSAFDKRRDDFTAVLYSMKIPKG
jgi:hypothetical protein